MCIILFGTFLCRPVLNYTVKWPNSDFCVEREHSTLNFRFSPRTVTPSLQIQLLGSSATLDRLSVRVGIITKRFKTLWSHFNLKWRFPSRCRRGCLRTMLNENGEPFVRSLSISHRGSWRHDNLFISCYQEKNVRWIMEIKSVHDFCHFNSSCVPFIIPTFNKINYLFHILFLRCFSL